MTLLYHWLGETLIRQERYEERLQLGEEGLALLDDDRQSIGGALMNQTIAFAAWALGDWERARALTLKTASFIRDLPWTEELSIPYDHIGFVYALEKDMETSNAFKQAAIEKAKTVDGFHYLMAQLYSAEPMNHFFSGDLWGSIQTQRDHLKIARRVGRIDSQVWGLLRMAWRRFLLGDLKGTATQLVEIRPRLESAGRPGLAAMYTWIRGQIALCRGEPRTALRVLRDAASVTTVGRDITEYLLGRTHLALGQRGEALRAFEKGLRERVEHQDTVENPDYLLFPRTPRCLAGTEEAHERSAAFRAWYRQRPELIDPAMPIDPWTLVEADSPRHSRTARVPGTVTTAEWSWEDPFGDCNYRMEEAALTLNAANGRHLWYVNVSAPRLLRPLPADVTDPVIQATCEPALDDRPAIGGLLLWHDDENYLWLDIGRFERRDVAFGGCLENRDRVIGRGLLPEGPAPGWAVGEPVTLRFEVTGDRVDALCSLDREQWFSVGHATFPVDKEAQVGVHAIGMIDRTIYHGAYPEGTAIRFTGFEVWEGQP
jgi:tetratricopeptide (TPR) repeat protein